MRKNFTPAIICFAVALLAAIGCSGPGGAEKSFGKKANLGTLTLSLGQAHFGAPPTIANRRIPLGSTSDVVLLQIRASVDSVEGINLGSIILDATGSGHDVDDLALASPVAIYFDANGNGAIDAPGDVLLDSRSFSADNGTAVMAIGRPIPAGGFENYIVAYDFSAGASAAGGDTFQPVIDAATAVVATGAVSGIAPIVNGGTISGAIAEIVGSLTVDEGLQNPAARSLSSYAAGVVMLQASLAADGAENIVLSSVTIQSAGTGNDAADVQAVELYSDANSNGSLDPGVDLKLGTTQTYATDNGTVVFSGFTHTTPAGGTTNIMVVYTFNSATGGFTYDARLEAAGFTAQGALSMDSPFVTGLPAQGNTVTTIQTGILTVSKGANCPVSNVYVPEGTATQPILQANLAVDSYEAITVTQVIFSHSGTGVISGGTPDVASFMLYRDADGSGTLTPGDQLINSAPTVTATTITFNFSRMIGVSTSEDWLLLYTFATGLTNSGGHTFSASISSNSSIAAAGAFSGPLGATITPVGSPSFPIAGPAPTATLIETLTVSRGANDPGNQGYMPTAVRVALQIRLDATCGPVSVTSLTLTPSGTGNDSTALSSLQIYTDDGNGIYDGTETLITSGVYSADDTSRTYSFSAQTVTPGTPLFWIVVYTLSGGNPGDTFRTEVSQASHVSASGTGSSQSLTPLGTYPVQGGIITYTNVTLTLSASTRNPATNAAVSRSTANVLMLGLNLAASNGTVDVTSITVTASGMGDDNLHVSSAAVYEDTNNDGVGDTLLGTNNTPYSSDNGTTTFTFSSPYPQIPNGGSENWVVVYSFNTANVWVGCTFRAGIAQNSDLSAQDSSTGSAATVTGVGASGIHGAYRAIEGIWHQMTVNNSGILPLGGHVIHHAAYDANADSMIVFGGIDQNLTNLHPNTTFEMTLAGNRNAPAGTESWAQINNGAGLNDPPSTVGGIFQYFTTNSGANQYIVFYSGYINTPTTYNSTVFLFDLTSNNNAWSMPTVTNSPPPFITGTGGRIGMSGIVDNAGSNLRLVTFSGYCYDTVNGTQTMYNDVYFLSLGTNMQWTSAGTLTGAPGTRAYAGSVFDSAPSTARMIIMGGQSLTTSSLQDAYDLSLGTSPQWGTLLTPSQERERHSAVMDPVVNQVIYFGGNDLNWTSLNDIEIYELSSGSSVWSWTQAWMSGAPSVRCWHTAVWDSNTHRMIVFGGYDNSSGVGNSEVWELY